MSEQRLVLPDEFPHAQAGSLTTPTALEAASSEHGALIGETDPLQNSPVSEPLHLDEATAINERTVRADERTIATGTATQTVMFTDLADYTASVARSDREGVRRILAEHEAAVRPLVERFGGRVVKNIGDSFMCLFTAATDALKIRAPSKCSLIPKLLQSVPALGK